ncbi:MAG TPA: hypothetical protein PKA95_05825 [Thermomicrobiales bacterium]|nr:hypothetical protein [Thermomicrobiales bacterium]
MSDRVIGRVVRLQIQRSSLKVGPPKGRRYDPTPILSVERLILTEDGAEAVVDGARLLDVHNARHPDSKNRGINDLSMGFTGNYQRIRSAFGVHVVDGIAGESILVAAETPPDLEMLTRGVEIETVDGGWVALAEASVAHPCVEFSRFCLGPDGGEPRRIKEALLFLDGGTRGFYLGLPAGAPVEIAVGAGVRLRN